MCRQLDDEKILDESDVVDNLLGTLAVILLDESKNRVAREW